MSLPQKKVFVFLLVFFVAFLNFSFVFALGEPCCFGKDSGSDSHCPSGEKCHCVTEPGDCLKNNGTFSGSPIGICAPANEVIICPFTKFTDLPSLIQSILNYIFYFALVVAPLMIVIGGFLFLTSAGDPKKYSTGINLIKWTTVGLAIVLFSRFIFSALRGVFQVG